VIGYYKKEDKLVLAVDCTIFGFDHEGLKILLIRRAFQPQKGKWSLVGGFLKRKENLPEAARRILKTYTGLEDIYPEQVHTFSEVDRDPGDRTVSSAYFALINIAEHPPHLTEKYSAQWHDVAKLPKLIFDHNSMVKHALDKLRQKASTEPITFELLPEKFTMPQLKKVYEAIWNTQLDKRNFINKINSFNFLKKLDEKEKTTSKRGAFYYKFDRKLYAANQKGNFNLKY
jgi:8-oxo-dGTP diphosphatase